jgi:hypothetical protein
MSETENWTWNYKIGDSDSEVDEVVQVEDIDIGEGNPPRLRFSVNGAFGQDYKYKWGIPLIGLFAIVDGVQRIACAAERVASAVEYLQYLYEQNLKNGGGK